MTHSADYLLQMVRQIVANQPRDFDEETNAHRVASHLQRFWAPSMLAELKQLPAEEEADPVMARVMALLREP